MFKRPTLKVKPGPKLQFVTQIRGSGARASEWAPVYDNTVLIPNGMPGLVGEIVDKMRLGAAMVKRPTKTVWKPSVDYEFIAKHMPEKQRDAYIARCKEWFAEHTHSVQTRSVRQPPNLDRELIAKFFAKHCPHMPPVEERIVVYREAGYPEDYIERVRVRDAKLEAVAEERQKVLDTIFAKWPAASKTDTKKKVIKAVKKRVPV